MHGVRSAAGATRVTARRGGPRMPLVDGGVYGRRRSRGWRRRRRSRIACRRRRRRRDHDRVRVRRRIASSAWPTRAICVVDNDANGIGWARADDGESRSTRRRGASPTCDGTLGVRSRERCARRRAAGVARGAGGRRADRASTALMPGLVNGHTHVGDDALSRLRRRPAADGVARAAHLACREAARDEDVYWGTRLACLEMIRTGTVFFWDMYWHTGGDARARSTTRGLRAVIGAPLIDGGDPAESRSCSRRGADGVARCRSPSASGERTRPALAPHAI